MMAMMALRSGNNRGLRYAALSLTQRAPSHLNPSPAPGDAASSLSAGSTLRQCSSCACLRDTRIGRPRPFQTALTAWVARWS